jgi:hypothetical protein
MFGCNKAAHPFDSKPAAFLAPPSDVILNTEYLFSDSTKLTQTEPHQLSSYARQSNPEAVGSVVQETRVYRTSIQQHAPRGHQQNASESYLNIHSVSQCSPATDNLQEAGSSTAPQQQLNHSNEQQQQRGYRFGDLTRSVIEAGKAKDGRKEKDGYKFGDFTRGLFNS